MIMTNELVSEGPSAPERSRASREGREGARSIVRNDIRSVVPCYVLLR